MKPKILPPTYFIVLLPLSIGLHLFLPVQRLFYSSFGAILALFGIIITVWADAMFKKRGTTVKPHETPSSLEISGPFRISRHPMYMGMAAILLGAAMLMGSLTAFLPTAIFIILMDRIFIPLEEGNMEKTFGDKYMDYKKRVRRWI